MENVVIIGGGVAGLSCLNALLDVNIKALLLEGATVGLPKVCGEFIAPLPTQQLQQWNIGPIHPIHHAQFNTRKTSVTIPFKNHAGAMSRSNVERELARRAKQLGATIREQARIKQIHPKTDNQKYFKIVLDTEEEVIASSLIIALGRLQKENRSVPMIYTAGKMHFGRLIEPHNLFMFSLPNAYLGIVPISDKFCNCAFLSVRPENTENLSISSHLTHLVAQQPQLKLLFDDLNLNHLEILHTEVPEFCIKKTPLWQDAYFIGDALVSFPPAVGSGFAHSIESGVSAARFCQKADFVGYRKYILHEIKQKFWLGKMMHTALLRPALSTSLLFSLQLMPQLGSYGLRKLKFL